jgi:hypothetical protein
VSAGEQTGEAVQNGQTGQTVESGVKGGEKTEKSKAGK